MELVQQIGPRPIRVAIFDFDGTLSLLRTGWQRIMVSLMSEVLSSAQGESGAAHIALPDLKHSTAAQTFQEDSPDLRDYLREVVDNTTGQQIVDQMLVLAQLEQSLLKHAEIRNHARLSERALQLKATYLERLKDHMDERLQRLRRGAQPASEFLVPGATDFLNWLASRGVKLCLISGTDQASVACEAELLGIKSSFDRIFGGLDVTGAFTKQKAMQQVISQYGADTSEVVAFGDGIMDIRSARDVGALAVGVASDEIKRTGVDPLKRKQLIDAGADAIIGDYGSFPDWIGRIMTRE